MQADVDVAAIRGDSELLDIVQEHVCPSFGACPSMGTACTMQILGEALNLVLPGTSTIPAADNLKLRSCVRAGRFIVEQVRRGICPEDLMSREVLFNTVMLDLAIAGSTNAVLHLLAYSQELGLGLTLDDFDRIARRIKCLVGVVPSGRHTVIDLDRAGGVPAVMKRLETELYTGETTLLGNTWGEYLTGVQVPDDSIIHPLQAPLSDIAGMRILRGNLAEEGAVCRPTGVPESMRAFSGRARVFDQEELAAEAVMRDEIQAGDVIVLRYEGPKGSPGMNELMKVTDRLIAKGMEQTVALITDGRFSGFNHGTIIGHVAPEAMAGGLIAFVEDGDIITYSIPEGILQLEVTEDVIAERKQRWKKPEPKIKSGVLALYGATSGQAFLNGVTGERFCVRNSGADAVVEGVGDHGCEYMTGGRVVILGPTGRNFAAGMSGGIAYVLDEDHDLYLRLNKELVSMGPVTEEGDIEALRGLIQAHAEATGSPKAGRILANFGAWLPKFKKILPHDYDRMLRTIAWYEAQGMGRVQAETEAFYVNARGKGD